MIVKTQISSKNNIWEPICHQAEVLRLDEPALEKLLQTRVLSHETLLLALSCQIASKIQNEVVAYDALQAIIYKAFQEQENIEDIVYADMKAVFERDPACQNYLYIFLFFKGFLALQAYRAMHWLMNHNQKGMALYIQSRVAEVFAVDIHPAAKIGSGILMDHATSVVIGETACVGNEVSMLHGVTLGGNGKQTGDRHPKIGDGVLLSVGAQILGNISIGDYSRIGAGSVVLDDIPAYSTAVGVPAKIINQGAHDKPAKAMNHSVK